MDERLEVGDVLHPAFDILHSTRFDILHASFPAAPRPPQSLHLNDQRDSRNCTVMVIATATGSPLSSVGVKVHCRTASSAA
jgi:hypothetical protein